MQRCTAEQHIESGKDLFGKTHVFSACFSVLAAYVSYKVPFGDAAPYILRLSLSRSRALAPCVSNRCTKVFSVFCILKFVYIECSGSVCGKCNCYRNRKQYVARSVCNCMAASIRLGTNDARSPRSFSRTRSLARYLSACV